ncbi:hypothetical protein [Brevibacterium album]|uniref:hypothetical protein n=1 Tax=Brevibacterium album TaxID=417948 RepID=UPI0004104C56|nr:hypothetical protein [Brevibacterium album]
MTFDPTRAAGDPAAQPLPETAPAEASSAAEAPAEASSAASEGGASGTHAAEAGTVDAQQQAFERFLATMPERLEAFIAGGLPASVAVEDEEREFVKDLTPASLPWVEAYAVSRLASPALAAAPANRRLAEDLMRYVGETLIRTLGGTWTLEDDHPQAPDHGMPSVRLAAPASEAVPAPGTVTVSVFSLLMTALQERTGEVFISALIAAAGDSPAEALDGGDPAGSPSDPAPEAAAGTSAPSAPAPTAPTAEAQGVHRREDEE